MLYPDILIPKTYLNIEGEKAIMLIDYDATELTAFKGQEFIIEKEESGWTIIKLKIMT